MIIEQHNDHVSILHNEIAITISGYVKLVYKDKSLSVIVNSIPEMIFTNISIKDIMSDITIETL